MLSIRLSRIGKRKQPHYRLIVTEKTRDPWGKAVEILGTYNPHTDPATINFKSERISYWLKNGAEATDTVWNMLVDQKIVEGEKRQKVKISKKRKEKLAKKAEELKNKKAEAQAKEEKKKAEPVPVSEPMPEAAPESKTEEPQNLVNEEQTEEKPIETENAA
ncbi:MAG: 30S ribosomal protein S16 [Patescibacteria group bacterium]|nr:30S ribosomal protein S16 [Patescibacteria group bacterium]MBU2509511.1 30S ribosomal protein S16 [Patescibacteria group bacterium]